MKKYALLGHPLSHSFSKKYFSEKFKNHFDFCYENIEIPDLDLFFNSGKINEYSGLNITIPFKEKIITYLDQIDKTAGEIKSVNVIKIIGDKDKICLKGFNTDIIGFEKSITPLLKDHHKHALILGTGGSSKSIAYVLGKLGISCLFVSRTPIKGQISYNEITDEIIRKHTLIINTTPLGMFPNIDVMPDIQYNQLSDEHLLFDLNYNPEETKFLKLGKENGATVKNGYEMLCIQADEAWKIWNGQ